VRWGYSREGVQLAQCCSGCPLSHELVVVPFCCPFRCTRCPHLFVSPGGCGGYVCGCVIVFEPIGFVCTLWN
jgi:hypothetical protein